MAQNLNVFVIDIVRRVRYAIATMTERNTERNTMMSGMVVAETILAQLGGARRLQVMTGARDFVGGEAFGRGFVQFKIGRGARDGINKVRVELDPSDTYTVKFYKTRGVDFAYKGEVSGVYCDTLVSTFEARTGFRLGL